MLLTHSAVFMIKKTLFYFVRRISKTKNFFIKNARLIRPLFFLILIPAVTLGFGLAAQKILTIKAEQKPSAFYLTSSSLLTDAAPWPTFGHDNTRSGQSEYNGPATSSIKWTYAALSEWWSPYFGIAPIIGKKNVLYIAHGTERKLYALQPASDGKSAELKWIFSDNGNPLGNKLSAPSIAADGIIYIGSDTGWLYAINPDGTLKWKFTTDTGHWVGTPAIDDSGIIYFSTSYNLVDQKKDYLYAINPDGTVKWRYEVANWGSFSTTSLGPNGTVYTYAIYIPSFNNTLYAVNPDGTLKWQKYYRPGTLPVVGPDGTIYFNNVYVGLEAIDPDTGVLKWFQHIYPSLKPSVSKDGLIAADDSATGVFYVLNPDGSTKWSKTGLGKAYTSSAAIGMDGIVYITTTIQPGGRLYALDIKDGSEKWHLDGIWGTSPAIGSDGTLYVGTGKNIYAIGEKPPEKEVPLYTQIESPYPSDVETKKWSAQPYANGSGAGYCGLNISQCGCGIASSAMVLRYHDVISAKNNNVDPYYINQWLENNGGYGKTGDIFWGKVAVYSDNKVKFAKTDGTPNNYALLDNYLAQKNPAIAKELVIGADGKNRGHFIVIDKKLDATYGVKDPYWYNTKTLNDTVGDKIYAYNNNFRGLRFFVPGDGKPVSSISLALGSPAEFLITDPSGKRLGKDSNTGIEYNEIPSGNYYSDGIDDPSGETPPSGHETKWIYIDSPVSGNYDGKVFGTGEGTYMVELSAMDTNNAEYSKTFAGNTAPGVLAEYNLSYNPDNSSNAILEPQDKIAPTMTAEVSGTKGANGWYVSDVLVSLSAKDNDGGVGVFKTEYSLDNGAAWNTYGSPITFNTEGVNNLLYRSEDYVGNLEEAKSLAIKIDKTPPEAKIYFDKDNQNLKVEGVDNLSAITVSAQDKAFTITDEAGHTLKLSFDQLNQNGKEIKARLASIQYDGEPAINAPASLNYEWSLDKNGAILELAQKIENGKDKIQAKYNFNKNETEIKGGRSQTMAGLVIIKLITKSGVLDFEYGQ